MSWLLYDHILWYVSKGISTIGVLVITRGAIRSLYHLYYLILYRKLSANYIRLQFGNNMILGLEFMVGGDIIGSLIAPDYYNVGLLAIIVVIRTILSYFLSRELEVLTPQQRQQL